MSEPLLLVTLGLQEVPAISIERYAVLSCIQINLKELLLALILWSKRVSLANVYYVLASPDQRSTAALINP